MFCFIQAVVTVFFVVNVEVLSVWFMLHFCSGLVFQLITPGSLK